MKNKTFKMLSLVLAVVMIFSMSTVAFAAEAESTDNVAEFGDILYSDDGVTVFYGNPNENIELAEQVEAQARSLQYDYAWVDANTYTTRYISIPASTANPLTYYTIKQEADSLVLVSDISVQRPMNDGYCLTLNWDETTYMAAEDCTISSSTMWGEWNPAYAWTEGTLDITWTVQTGSSGARLCVWAW